MKTDRKKGILLGLCMMAVGIFCMDAKVQAAETETSQVSVTSENTENPNSQGEDISDGSVRTDDKETIFPGIYIGSVDVSGMTAEEAREAVTQFVDSEKSFLMNLDIGDTQIPATTGDVGLCWGNTRVVDQAMALGRQGNAVRRFKMKKALEKGSYTFDLKYDIEDEKARSFLENRCAPECNKEPVEPTMEASGSSLQVIDGQNGCTLRVDESVEAIRNYLGSSWNGGAGTISLAYDVTEPTHKKEELDTIQNILGKADTDYSLSSKARSSNIATAAKLINGTVLYPGETFSTLDTITPFTEENGYALAGSYANGTTTETFGGGICQVSTTLYLAVLRAELEVTERKNHSMLVTYVKPSMDAAIAESSGKDFKFKNNTDNPIYIYMVAYNGTLVARVYGAEYRPSNRTVEYESVTLSTQDAEMNIKTSSALSVGVISQSQSPHKGCVAELYKIVKEDGQEVSRERVNSSNYAKSNGVIEVGTKGASAEVAAALAQAAATNDLSQVKQVLATMGR